MSESKTCCWYRCGKPAEWRVRSWTGGPPVAQYGSINEMPYDYYCDPCFELFKREQQKHSSSGMSYSDLREVGRTT